MAFRKSVAWTVFGSLLLIVCPSAFANAPLHEVTFLGEGFGGVALNEHGDAVGWFTAPGGGTTAAAAIGGNSAQALPLPEGMTYSVAYDINNDGVIVGGSSTFANAWLQPIATVWRPNGSGWDVELLGTYSTDPYSIAYAVNDAGDIVGGSGHTPWSWSSGVLFAGGDVTRIADLMNAIDVNEERQVLSGSSSLLDLDTMTVSDLGAPDGTWNGPVLTDVNNLGEVCGRVMGYWSECNTFSVIFTHDAGWAFVSGCGTYTTANAINDVGDVLIYYQYGPVGVLFHDDALYGVGDLVNRDASVWFPQSAADINNARQILVSVKNLDTDATGSGVLTRTGGEVSNEPPVTGIAASPLVGKIPFEVQFLSDGEWDPDGEVVSYLWDFGDGATSTEADPVHTYTRAGTFTVTLTVTDDDGDTGTATISIRAKLLACSPVAADEDVATAAVNWAPLMLVAGFVFAGGRRRPR